MASQNTIPMENRLFTLEEKDVRRDAHYKTLNIKIDDLTDSQKQVVMLLSGSSLNNNKGMFHLLEKMETKFNLMEKQVIDMQKDIDNSKFWGRFATVVLGSLIALMLQKIFDH